MYIGCGAAGAAALLLGQKTYETFFEEPEDRLIKAAYQVHKKQEKQQTYEGVRSYVRLASEARYASTPMPAQLAARWQPRVDHDDYDYDYADRAYGERQEALHRRPSLEGRWYPRELSAGVAKAKSVMASPEYKARRVIHEQRIQDAADETVTKADIKEILEGLAVITATGKQINTEMATMRAELDALKKDVEDLKNRKPRGVQASDE